MVGVSIWYIQGRSSKNRMKIKKEKICVTFLSFIIIIIALLIICKKEYSFSEKGLRKP
jgi:uncharacterized membrane protein